MKNSLPRVAVDDAFTHRLTALVNAPGKPLLSRGLRGIEKESLRIDAAGKLALTPHPAALGAALTHPQLTTDYSEALLEFITSPAPDAADALTQLDALHRFVYSKLGDEMLWPQSMPCVLPPEDEIPIAQYGSSHNGRFKNVYRRGLALRYGRTMQCIAGIHYNFSLDDTVWQTLEAAEGKQREATCYRSEGYMGLLRNFRRYSWLLLYLFGASPALCASFIASRTHNLEALQGGTFYLPYATSLRMSDLGYQNTSAQSALTANLDSLDSYLKSLALAVSKPHPAYAALGTHRDGEWIQLNGNVLQIENELYATIRPKRVVLAGERPLQALAARGVQYIEARCLDIDPFEPTGIGAPLARFMDAFLTFCALEESPPLSSREYGEANANFGRVAREGRRPGLTLTQADGSSITLTDWAEAMLERIDAIAAQLDRSRSDGAYAKSVAEQRAKLADSTLTPSARVLDMLRQPGMDYARFGLEQAERHAAYFRARPLDAATQTALVELAQQSIDEQRALESRDSGSFEAFVAAYHAALPPKAPAEQAARL